MFRRQSVTMRAPLVTALLLALLPAIAPSGARAAVVDPSYRLHGGDVLNVQLIGEDPLATNMRVLDDGTISLPLAGVVHVGGETTAEAAVTIAGALKRFYKTPNVVVDVQQLGTIQVLVSGAVQHPGAYTIRPGAHASDAIAAAGGMDPNLRGALPDGRLVYADAPAQRLKTEAIVRGGDAGADPVLSDHASIFIPGPQQINVTVLGAVDTPGVITINEGDRLAAAIAQAGTSANAHSDLDLITVTRTEPDGTTASHQVDLYRAIQGDQRYNPVLRKGDVVYVPINRRTKGALTNALFLIQTIAGAP